MRQRIITGMAFTAGVAMFIIPAYWFPIFLALFILTVGIITFSEMYKALKAGGMQPTIPMLVVGGLATLQILMICYMRSTPLTTALSIYLLIIVMFCIVCAVVPSIVRPEGNHLADGIVTGLTILYITFPLFCLGSVGMLVENGWFLMIPALFASWVSDTCAYFAGVTLGKHKIVPHISPKKTWEGCIGGVLGCAIAVMLYFDIVIYQMNNINIGFFLFSLMTFGLGAVMSVLSQFGDWLASLVKRRVGIKDYGDIFPGHGGMLDRFDSAFFTIPTGVLLALISVLFT